MYVKLKANDEMSLIKENTINNKTQFQRNRLFNRRNKLKHQYILQYETKLQRATSTAGHRLHNV